MTRGVPARAALRRPAVMTALDRYAKLEAVARYLDGRSPESREVVTSFGERSLVIMGLDDRPIAHWPLASLRALGGPDERPLEIVPDAASDERLLLDDPEMAAAIAEVCPDLHRATPAPPRRRRAGLRVAVAVAVVLAASIAAIPFLPERLVDLVPPEREAALGEALARRMPAPGAAAPAAICVAEEGAAALRIMSERLGDAGLPWPVRISVLDAAAADALALPGGRIHLTRGLIEAARSPEEIAGILAHAIGHARARDPLIRIMDAAGAGGVAALLVGDITGAALVAGAGASLGAPHAAGPESAADAVAFGTLAAAGLPARPYADLAARLSDAGASYAARHPWTAGRRRAAMAADTIGDDPFRPALRDRDWIALGSICDRTRPAAAR